MNDEQKRAAIAVLDRMTECGWIQKMARRIDGDVTFEPTEKGFATIKSLQQLFLNGEPLNPLELSIFVELVKRFDQIR
jgi:hypothetical protein